MLYRRCHAMSNSDLHSEYLTVARIVRTLEARGDELPPRRLQEAWEKTRSRLRVFVQAEYATHGYLSPYTGTTKLLGAAGLEGYDPHGSRS